MSVIATFLPLYHAAAVLIAIATKINAAFSISTWPGPPCRNVATTATSTPTPAHWMPLRAVTGDDMRLMPMISSTAAAK